MSQKHAQLTKKQWEWTHDYAFHTYGLFAVPKPASLLLALISYENAGSVDSFQLLLFGAPAIVGDITPSDGVPKEEKSRREKEALDHMCELLGGGSRGEYQNLQL